MLNGTVPHEPAADTILARTLSHIGEPLGKGATTAERFDLTEYETNVAKTLYLVNQNLIVKA